MMPSMAPMHGCVSTIMRTAFLMRKLNEVTKRLSFISQSCLQSHPSRAAHRSVVLFWYSCQGLCLQNVLLLLQMGSVSLALGVAFEWELDLPSLYPLGGHGPIQR